MKKYLIIILLLLSTSVLGCLTNVPEEDNGESVKYISIPVSEAKIKVDSGEYFILDVRTQEEYDAGHIANSLLIPHTDISDRLDEVPEDMPILVYCRSGRRSAIASQALIDNGYSEVYNMQGGFNEWENAGYPVQK
ncbi:MAG: rhodanese-like domain-containing protein [Methanosarcinales archaeon]|nr:rhodanese-like domain-containing protein [Methanosarcinales archaeon]